LNAATGAACLNNGGFMFSATLSELLADGPYTAFAGKIRFRKKGLLPEKPGSDRCRLLTNP